MAALAPPYHVEIPSSKLKKEITKILLDQGFILNYKVSEDDVLTIESSRIYNF